jgi:hypothetical protein
MLRFEELKRREKWNYEHNYRVIKFIKALVFRLNKDMVGKYIVGIGNLVGK